MALLVGVVVVAACSSNGSDGSGSGASGGGGSGGSGAAGGSGGSGAECPGVDPWPEGTQTCHHDGECMYGCSPFTENGCGACEVPMDQCMMDMDCGPGFVCNPHPWSSPCPCNGETVERFCQAICPATACAEDETCDEATGFCNPTSCQDGYTCAPGLTCQMTPWSDEHDCRPFDCSEMEICTPNQTCEATPQGYQCITKACQADQECACGACVNGHCEGRIGACYEPAA